MGSADLPGKMDEKLKSENMQKKSSLLCLCYILIAIRAGRCTEKHYADHIFSGKNARFRSQIFFTSGGKGAFAPLTKILRSFLGVVICLERGADLHMAQLMPMSLASVKSRLVLTFWYRLTRVVPDKWPLNWCVFRDDGATNAVLLPGAAHIVCGAGSM